MISFKHKGNFSKTYRYLDRVKRKLYTTDFEKYAKEAVSALATATPVDSGCTANSWYYKIKKEDGRVTISFHNSNIQNGILIAVILQYGHATRNGGWVEGRDYINPTIQPIFDGITKKAVEEVTRV